MSSRLGSTKRSQTVLFAAVAVLTVVACSCTGYGGTVTRSEEESGTQLGLHESYDAVRNGARLVLVYDEETNAFEGFVENTTDATLEQVRAEVHLSNGAELGPTTPADLHPGEIIAVSLTATSTDFDRWTAHPEVGGGGGGEHGDGEEGDDHDEEREEEHSEGDAA